MFSYLPRSLYTETHLRRAGWEPRPVSLKVPAEPKLESRIPQRDSASVVFSRFRRSPQRARSLQPRHSDCSRSPSQQLSCSSCPVRYKHAPPFRRAQHHYMLRTLARFCVGFSCGSKPRVVAGPPSPLLLQALVAAGCFKPFVADFSRL